MILKFERVYKLRLMNVLFKLVFSNYFKSIKIKKIKLMNEFCGRFETFFSLKNFN